MAPFPIRARRHRVTMCFPSNANRYSLPTKQTFQTEQTIPTNQTTQTVRCWKTCAHQNAEENWECKARYSKKALTFQMTVQQHPLVLMSRAGVAHQ